MLHDRNFPNEFLELKRQTAQMKMMKHTKRTKKRS